MSQLSLHRAEKRSRQRRAVRAMRRVVLTSRDREILTAIGKLRFTTTMQLARLYFGGSRSAANKRLRKLYDGRLVRAWVRELARENVYTVDRRGGVLLASESDRSTYTVPRGLDGHLDHLLAVNEVRIALAQGLSEDEAEIHW
jgi:DNA-binding transcriptional ArsR family regulator